MGCCQLLEVVRYQLEGKEGSSTSSHTLDNSLRFGDADPVLIESVHLRSCFCSSANCCRERSHSKSEHCGCWRGFQSWVAFFVMPPYLLSPIRQCVAVPTLWNPLSKEKNSNLFKRCSHSIINSMCCILKDGFILMFRGINSRSSVRIF
jgi:hypothetical protein